MHHARRVDVLETAEDLVQKVLDKLLFERARGEEAVQIGAEKLGDKVAVVSVPLWLKRFSATLPLLNTAWFKWQKDNRDSHVLKGGDEDVAERNDLPRQLGSEIVRYTVYITPRFLSIRFRSESFRHSRSHV